MHRLMILWLSCLLSLILISNSALAQNSAELNQQLCARMLGLTLTSAVPGQPLEFDRMAGMGMRGFLGSFPESTAPEAAPLPAQGLNFWGQAFAVKKSLAEAQAHDLKFHGLGKVIYLISDVDVTDLTDESPAEVVQARFDKIFTESPMYYWDDSENMLSGSPIPAKLIQVDKEMARRLIATEVISYFTKDDRGPRFMQTGWTFSKIRGVLRYATVFESGSTTNQKSLRNARSLAAKGYTFTFNQNFKEALDMARDQVRLEKDANGVQRKVAPNSRYLIHPEVYNKTLAAYHAGHAFSAEVRDPNGRLIAGILGERHGNIVALETVFYAYEERPDGSFKSHIDEAKMAALSVLIRLHEYGIDVADAGMVTPFTAGLKGVYISAENFAAEIEGLRRQPVIEIDFSKPWVP